MYSLLADEILTETIKKMSEGRIGRRLKKEYVEYLYSVIIELYKLNKWIRCPVTQTEQGPAYMRLYLTNVQKKGYYFIIFSDMKYYNKCFGTGISMISIQAFFDMYFNCSEADNNRAGIIFNPGTSEEFIINDACIQDIFMLMNSNVN